MKVRLTFAVVLLLAMVAVGAMRVGEAAPNFTATDSNGHPQSLAQYKGRYVVL